MGMSFGFGNGLGSTSLTSFSININISHCRKFNYKRSLLLNRNRLILNQESECASYYKSFQITVNEFCDPLESAIKIKFKSSSQNHN